MCATYLFYEVLEIDLGVVLMLDTLYELSYIASASLHHFLLPDVIDTPNNITPTFFTDVFAEMFKYHTCLLFFPVFSGYATVMSRGGSLSFSL